MRRPGSWVSLLTGAAPAAMPETRAALRRRRAVVAGVSAAGAGLLGVSLSTKPGSPRFYCLTFAVAGAWLAGGLSSGTIHLGQTPPSPTTTAGKDAIGQDSAGHGTSGEDAGGQSAGARAILAPIGIGAAAFAAFYGAALVCRHVPILNRAIGGVLQYADRGSDALVLATTLANGVGEEVFFRGALYAAAGPARPVATSTAGYMLATTATGNPALVLASGVMGTLFARQRRATGGVLAPTLTHLTWSALMLRYLPPLFRDTTTRDTTTSAPPRH